MEGEGGRCEGSFVGGVEWRVKGVGVRVHLWEG